VLAARGAARFCDLHVYRLGGQDVLSGTPLSQVNYAGALPFTYPPAAALVFTVFAVLPWPAAASLMTTASAIALPAALYFALRLPPVSSWLDRPAAAWLAVVAAAGALWLEPVRTTLAYGQVNILLALLVTWDLSRPDGTRLKGAALGLAAGIKLIPAIYVVYLLLTRRYRAAAVATGTFAATIGAGFAIVPSSARWYWTGTFLDAGRVASGKQQAMTINQSLLGMLARQLHTTKVPVPWLALVVLVGLAGLALAARAGRAGNEAAGFSLCAITGLLVCPVSWTHHWVIAVPALLLAAVTSWHTAAPRRPATLARLAVLAAVAAAGWAGVVRHAPRQAGPLHFLLGNGYVLIGLAALAVAAWPLASDRHESPGGPAAPAGQPERNLEPAGGFLTARGWRIVWRQMHVMAWWSGLSRRRRLLLGVVALVVAAGAASAGVRAADGGAGPVPAAADKPGDVLLVPGYGGSTGSLDVLAAKIRATGRTAIVARLAGNGTGDLHVQANVLNGYVNQALSSGSGPVTVIGYSAGGVVAWLWDVTYDGAAKARDVITLGSPLHGTSLASLGEAFLPGECPQACEQLVPGSALLTGLAGSPAARPPWLSLWTTDDQVVQPPDSARLPGAVNVPLQSVCPGVNIQHGQLPSNPLVIGIVLRALASPHLSAPSSADCRALTR
jgi:Glycosyltransferase family 87